MFTIVHKTADEAGKRTKKSAAVISPKQLWKLTKDDLWSLLTENKLPTTGTRPQLLQRLTKHFMSKKSPKRLQKTKCTCIQADPAGSSTPRRHPPTNVDSEPIISEHLPTSAKNSGSEPSSSEFSHQPAARVRRKRPHRSVSPSSEHYHTSHPPSVRQHSQRCITQR